MPSAPEFHPYVGYLSGSKRRRGGARTVLIATLVGVILGGGTVMALMSDRVAGSKEPALSTGAAQTDGLAGATPAGTPSAIAEQISESITGKDNKQRAAGKEKASADTSAASRADKPCAQQAWPHVERKCLSQSELPAKSGPIRVLAPNASADPTELAGGPTERATDGAAASTPMSGGQEAAQTASVEATILWPRPALGSAPEAGSGSQVAVGNTEPAKFEKARAATTRQEPVVRKKKTTQSRLARRRGSEQALSRRFFDYAEHDKPRAAQQWTEREYTLPDGRRHRVIIRRGGFAYEPQRSRD